MRNYVMEFIGTFFLVLAVGLTGNPLAIGLMLIALVYLGGHISGAHYNPAVSLAVMLRGKANIADTLVYWAVQLVAAFAGAYVIFTLTGAEFIAAPGEGVGMWPALLVEVLFTFVLAFVILTVATTKKFEKSHVYGLAIGITLAAIAFAGGGISGGAYNPAVGLGPIFYSYFMGSALAAHAWLYLVGPLVGGALAAYVFKYLNPKE